MRRLVVPFMLGIALACAGPAPDEEEDDAFGVDGGGDDSNTGESSSNDDCEAYIECVGAVYPEILGEVIDTYGDEGTCWDGGDETAEVCADACTTGLEDLRDAYEDEDACQGEPPEVDGCPFDDDESWILTLEGDSEGAYDVALECEDEEDGPFTLTFIDYSDVFECEADGLDVDCLNTELAWRAWGAFEEYQRDAAGEWDYGDGEYTGTFVLAVDR